MTRAEINEMESKKMKLKINVSKNLFFENINKIDKPLTRLIKKKRERTQINKIRSESGEITTDTKETQRIVRKFLHSFVFADYMPTNRSTWMK